MKFKLAILSVAMALPAMAFAYTGDYNNNVNSHGKQDVRTIITGAVTVTDGAKLDLEIPIKGKIKSIDPVRAFTVTVPRKAEVVTYSEPNFTGTKKTLPEGTSEGETFQSLSIQNASYNPDHTFNIDYVLDSSVDTQGREPQCANVFQRHKTKHNLWKKLAKVCEGENVQVLSSVPTGYFLGEDIFLAVQKISADDKGTGYNRQKVKAEVTITTLGSAGMIVKSIYSRQDQDDYYSQKSDQAVDIKPRGMLLVQGNTDQYPRDISSYSALRDPGNAIHKMHQFMLENPDAGNEGFEEGSGWQ